MVGISSSPAPVGGGSVADAAKASLVCGVGSLRCAIDLDHVVETMRPQPVDTLADAPAFVRGVSLVRDEVIPVVDLAAVLGVSGSAPARLVTLDLQGRGVGLLVDEVLGVQLLPAQAAVELPSLLRAAANDVVASLGVLDDALLVVLRASRLVPDEVWDLLRDAAGTR